MANPKVLEARKLEAAQQQAKDVAELNRKVDLIMAHLGIVDPANDAVVTASVVEGEPEVTSEPKPKSKNK